MLTFHTWGLVSGKSRAHIFGVLSVCVLVGIRLLSMDVASLGMASSISSLRSSEGKEENQEAEFELCFSLQSQGSLTLLPPLSPIPSPPLPTPLSLPLPSSSSSTSSLSHLSPSLLSHLLRSLCIFVTFICYQLHPLATLPVSFLLSLPLPPLLPPFLFSSLPSLPLHL